MTGYQEKIGMHRTETSSVETTPKILHRLASQQSPSKSHALPSPPSCHIKEGSPTQNPAVLSRSRTHPLHENVHSIREAESTNPHNPHSCSSDPLHVCALYDLQLSQPAPCSARKNLSGIRPENPQITCLPCSSPVCSPVNARSMLICCRTDAAGRVPKYATSNEFVGNNVNATRTLRKLKGSFDYLKRKLRRMEP
jgi:hypothetical protein